MKFPYPLLPFWFLSSCQTVSMAQDAGIRVEKPNILFIMTDDHAFQAISAYGSALIQTPGIDRLASEGVRFDRAFVTNSLCSPSRAATLTGKFSHRNGVRDNIDVFDSLQVTFPKLLQHARYHTAIVGKWHLKSTPTGFDYWKILPNQGDYYNPDFITPEGMTREKGYVTDLITDMAIAHLDAIRTREQPFMMMVHHKAPHREWCPSPEHLSAFHQKAIPEPSTLFDDYSRRGNAAKEAEMRIADHMSLMMDNKLDPAVVNKTTYPEFLPWYEDNYSRIYHRMSENEKMQWDAVYGPIGKDFAAKNLPGDDLTRWKYRRYMEDYLATILSVDESISRLLDYLDSTGLSENTLVIYTSDQGFYLGEHGWFDKRFMYEPSFRTPLIIRWPGIVPGGSVNTDLVQNIDYAPTILAAAGIQPPKDTQGKNFIPLIQGKNTGWRTALYYHYYEHPGIHNVRRHYGIRTDRYKLIHFYQEVDEWELYDLQQDPDEMHNIYGLVEYGRIQKKLHRQLSGLQKEYGDTDALASSKSGRG